MQQAPQLQVAPFCELTGGRYEHRDFFFPVVVVLDVVRLPGEGAFNKASIFLFLHGKNGGQNFYLIFSTFATPHFSKEKSQN